MSGAVSTRGEAARRIARHVARSNIHFGSLPGEIANMSLAAADLRPRNIIAGRGGADNKGYQTLTAHRNAVGAINPATLIGEKFRPSPLKCEPGFLAILRGLSCGRRNFSAAH
jgi:hypothetical protein